MTLAYLSPTGDASQLAVAKRRRMKSHVLHKKYSSVYTICAAGLCIIQMEQRGLRHDSGINRGPLYSSVPLETLRS